MKQSKARRYCTALTVVASLAGCSTKPASIEACENLLLPSLKAPSTYHLIEQTIGLSKPDGTQNVFLTYDAANSYNAPIRGTFWCVFDPRTGAAKLGQDEASVEADNLELMADNAAAAGENAVATEKLEPADHPTAAGSHSDDDSMDEVPVCDRPDSTEKRALMNEIGVDCVPD